MMRPNPLSALRLSVLVFGALCARDCPAQLDPWEFEVYPYRTTPRGMVEAETDNAFVADGHDNGGEGTAYGTLPSQRMWYNAYELTYGLTDRIEVAAYANMARADGGAYQWAGSNLRLRGRLFDEEILPVNVGWYAELEWHKTPQFDDARSELELRPIIEKDFGRLAVMLNPKFEKVLAGVGSGGGFEFGYCAAVQYALDRRISPGAEFYGGSGMIDHFDPIHDQQHYVFGTIWGELGGGIEYNLGVGCGLTGGSDRLIFKFNLELERFVGAIFKASSDRGWFF